MRLWLNHTGGVSLREQLVTQVMLGILCRELAPGERLPSTRELARRFRIHANTASAAYRQLENDGWLEFRHGSGVFVRNTRPSGPISAELAAELEIDQLIGELLQKARKSGASSSIVRDRLRRWLALEPPVRWLVVDPDPNLREILVFEMRQALHLPVSGCGPEDLTVAGAVTGSLPVARPSKADAIHRLLPAEVELITLQIHPVAASYREYLPQTDGTLVGIVSRWSEFQSIARTMLIAAGVATERLIVRDASRAGWRRGLEHTEVVICDAAIEAQLPKGTRPLPFRLLDAAFLAQLRHSEDSLTSAIL